MNSIPKLIPQPILSIDTILPSIRKFYKDKEGKYNDEINEIMAENMPQLNKHYDSEVKRIFHTPDVNSAYNEYKEYVKPRIDLIESLSNMAKNSNYHVSKAKNNSGSNSDEQVAASSLGSNARTRRDKLIGEVQRKEEEYKRELKEANMTSAKELIRYIKLRVLHPPAGGRRTRKYRNKKTRRKNANRDSMTLEQLQGGRK